MPKKTLAEVLAIINACLRLSYFPKYWKNAVIITIPKPGKDHKFPQNYRPISLLPSFSKILERIILTRLQAEINRLQLIPTIQFGFKKNHSNTLQVLRLAETIHEGFQNKDATAIAYLDTATLTQQRRSTRFGSFARCQLHKPSPHLIKTIQSFLHQRSFMVKVHKHNSSTRPVQAGVKQGSVLGLILYSIYTSDIPMEDYAGKALFADDAAVYAQCRNPDMAVTRLQNSVEQPG